MSTEAREGFILNRFGPGLMDFKRQLRQPGPQCRQDPAFYYLSAKLKATTKGFPSWSDKKVDHVTSQLDLTKELLHRIIGPCPPPRSGCVIISRQTVWPYSKKTIQQFCKKENKTIVHCRRQVSNTSS
jgi:hypothetical protein